MPIRPIILLDRLVSHTGHRSSLWAEQQSPVSRQPLYPVHRAYHQFSGQCSRARSLCGFAAFGLPPRKQWEFNIQLCASHIEKRHESWCSIPGGLHLFQRSEEHTSELQSHLNLVCRLLLEKKKKKDRIKNYNDI